MAAVFRLTGNKAPVLVLVGALVNVASTWDTSTLTV